MLTVNDQCNNRILTIPLYAISYMEVPMLKEGGFNIILHLNNGENIKLHDFSVAEYEQIRDAIIAYERL